MRSTNEQLAVILKRSGAIREKARLKKHMLADGIASALCLVLIVISVYGMPGYGAVAGAGHSPYGSLILGGQYLGLIVVGLLAFLLGVAFTLLCLHYKQYKAKGSRGDDRQ